MLHSMAMGDLIKLNITFTYYSQIPRNASPVFLSISILVGESELRSSANQLQLLESLIPRRVC